MTPDSGCDDNPYSIGDIVLREQLPPARLGNYACRNSAEFMEAIYCGWNGSKNARTSTIDELIIDLRTRTVLYARSTSYVYDGIKPADGRAISDRSAPSPGKPRREFSIDESSVTSWGEVRLEKIAGGTDEYGSITSSTEHHHGLLISTAENIGAAKDDNRPIYRVMGGDGALVVMSEREPKRRLVQQIIVAGSTLAEKNFHSRIDKFLRADQTKSDDTSKWADVAFMVRRLALNTTPEHADRVADEILGSYPNQKYRSHVWPYLPTSVISHLKAGTYYAIDIFSEKGEFPFLRDRMVAQLTRNPQEPFSEFLLYALGRFDQALQSAPASPVRTVLNYASGHASLRECLALGFSRLAKAGDRNLIVENIRPRSYIDDLDSEDLVTQYDNKTFKIANINYQQIQKQIEKYERKRSESQNRRSFAEINNDNRRKNFFNGHAYESISYSDDDYRDGKPSVSQYVSFFNQFPERYDSQPIDRIIPRFSAQCSKAYAHFNQVVKDPRSPHYDDAAYFIGWLDYHSGNIAEALNKFEMSIASEQPTVASIGNAAASVVDASRSGPDEMGSLSDQAKTNSGGATMAAVSPDTRTWKDYSGAAEHQVARILRTLPPEEAIRRVQDSRILSKKQSLWYATLNSLYRAHQYQSVMEAAQDALRRFGVNVKNLPVTTDDRRLREAVAKLGVPDEGVLVEIAYLFQSSLQARYLEYNISKADPKIVEPLSKQIKAIVTKYSLIKDHEVDKPARQGPKAVHRDLRHGSYLAQRALQLLPRSGEFTRLREWLHFKRITLLAHFDPIKIDTANREFQAEFPASSLLDDALAEQIFAEAVVMKDMARASATFELMHRQFPRANAIDNAYSWMAIGWNCAGEPDKAREVDQDIVRRFPFTRHARFARQRLRKPSACSQLGEFYNWDYHAMLWRERNRIDTIQVGLRSAVR